MHHVYFEESTVPSKRSQYSMSSGDITLAGPSCWLQLGSWVLVAVLCYYYHRAITPAVLLSPPLPPPLLPTAASHPKPSSPQCPQSSHYSPPPPKTAPQAPCRVFLYLPLCLRLLREAKGEEGYITHSTNYPIPPFVPLRPSFPAPHDSILSYPLTQAATSHRNPSLTLEDERLHSNPRSHDVKP